MDCSSLPLIGEADIVVCGGGTAGAFAAIAAADSGCRVLVAEQTGSLGGAAVNGLVVPMMNTGIPGNPQCSYISRRLHNELLESGGADASGMNFDPILLEAALERLCTDSGVRICFYTTLADVVTNGNKISEIVAVNKNGLGRIRGKIFIDATGDGDLSIRAGAEYTKGDPQTGKNQAVSLRYLVSGIDTEKFGSFIRETVIKTGGIGADCDANGRISVACCPGDRWAFAGIFDWAQKNGDLTEDDRIYWQGFSVYGRRGCIAFNNPEFFTHNDGTDSDDLTFIRLAGKRAILRQMSFYRKYLPGFENAYISDIASSVGVRESRNIVTEYVVTAEDLLSRRKFPDCICRSAYPVDIHGKTLNFSSVTPADDGKPWYELPFRALAVKGIDNLLVAGRCLGADFTAQSSIRVQHSARASGEAAGIGAALALEHITAPRFVNGADVRAVMLERGADFGEK